MENIFDNLPLPEFRFNDFKFKKEYELIMYNFFYPDFKTVSANKQGHKLTYSIWEAQTVGDYTQDGIPYQIKYNQQISKQSFKIALSRYIATYPVKAKSLQKHSEDIVDVKMIFARDNSKKMTIKDLKVLE